jgi:predicted RNA-binding Zn ribbon-like protein
MPANPSPIPPEVELVRSFVNTVDVDEGTEELAAPDDLSRWLIAAGLVPKGTVASGRDLRVALQLREALRSDLLANHDGDHSPADQAALDAACRELPLHAVSTARGLEPAVSGLRSGLAAIVAASVTSRIKGTWTRLKICPAEDCQWAFYDISRNRSKRWCSMETCGNRHKVRAFRDRAHT